MSLTVLSLCDRTGIWSEPFAAAGYRVLRWDLADGDDIRFKHWPGKVHGVIAQPPCTHLAVSGARWWEVKGIDALAEAMSLVDACLRYVAACDPDWWVLENPVGRLTQMIGPPRFTFDPCEYAGWADDPDAEAYTKRTCLWGRFIVPERRPVDPVLGSLMHFVRPSEDRAEKRSVTPRGFAQAFFAANGGRTLFSCGGAA